MAHPVFNILLVGLLALSAVSFDLEIALALINFGALVAFTVVNLSVISCYYLRQGATKPGKIACNTWCCPCSEPGQWPYSGSTWSRPP